jgi:hypothetical protein
LAVALDFGHEPGFGDAGEVELVAFEAVADGEGPGDGGFAAEVRADVRARDRNPFPGP